METNAPTEQLTVVVWKWGKYTANHVNILARALKLHLNLPHIVVCITDNPDGLDSTISTLPLPCTLGRINARRLWIFSEEAKILGRRILQLDLDMVITADITDLITRHRDADLVVWHCEAIGRIGFALNPSLLLLTTGTHTHVWTSYLLYGDGLVKEANQAGCAASDQAVITYLFTTPSKKVQRGSLVSTRTPTIPTWSRADGLVAFRTSMRHAPDSLPLNTRIVSFHGPHDPAQHTDLAWVREHWSEHLSTSQEVCHA